MLDIILLGAVSPVDPWAIATLLISLLLAGLTLYQILRVPFHHQLLELLFWGPVSLLVFIIPWLIYFILN